MRLFLIQKLTESIFENHRILTCSILGWMFCLHRSEAWAAKIEGSFGQEEKNGKELPKMLEMIFQYLPSSSTIHIHQKQFKTKVKCSKSRITIQKCHDFFDRTANSSMSQFDQTLRLVMIRLKTSHFRFAKMPRLNLNGENPFFPLQLYCSVVWCSRRCYSLLAWIRETCGSKI